MTAWLKATGWFQRIALALFLIAGLRWLVAALAGQGGKGALLLLAMLLLFFAFRQTLLWRVRNRLALTFLLLGVVPIVLICILALIGSYVAMSQYAAEQMRSAVEARTREVDSVTRELLVAASNNADAKTLEALRSREPGLRVIVQKYGKTVQLPPAGAILPKAPDGLPVDFSGVFEVAVPAEKNEGAAKAGQENDSVYYLGARRKAGDTEVFSYLPLDEETLAKLSPRVSVAGIVGGSVGPEPDIDVQGGTVVVGDGGRKNTVTSRHLPPAQGFWDTTVAGLLPTSAQLASGKPDDVMFIGLSRPSKLLEGILTGEIAKIAMFLLLAISVILLVVELTSLIFSITLTRTITRSVHDLYQGTLHVASNDFSHRIPVRGKHQLSELAAAFNGMTTQIGHYLGEMRKKEKLESELEIAREVQARLFPRAIPELKTLEMAGVCLPGRFVSGDYYDFVRLNEQFTAIALGDVSGKGVSAALLMASIQSSLHAQLKFSGAPLDPSLSTATLMALISQQLYESTPVEKYATFFCSVYDDETGALRYTNCGHLKPILVRSGATSTLDGGGLVVGLLPGVTYEQEQIALQPGDLLAIFSDGVSEAENATEEQYGEKRLSELLARHAAEPLDQIIGVVTEEVRKWTFDPDGRDDTTIVLLRARER